MSHVITYYFCAFAIPMKGQDAPWAGPRQLMRVASWPSGRLTSEEPLQSQNNIVIIVPFKIGKTDWDSVT